MLSRACPKPDEKPQRSDTRPIKHHQEHELPELELIQSAGECEKCRAQDRPVASELAEEPDVLAYIPRDGQSIGEDAVRAGRN